MQVRSKKTFARGLLFSFSAVWLLIAITSPINAQYRGSFQGTVTDATGAVVQDATVTLTSKETNISKTATTSSSGTYSIQGLAPGTYSLSVEKTGFAKKVLDTVTLASEQAQTQDVQLELPQQVTTTVTVSAESAPVLDTESATISSTISAKEIQALPTFSRDPFQAAVLAPGSFGDNARGASGSAAQNLPGSAGPGGTSGSNSIFQTENQVQVVANGTRNNSNSYQIDGVEVNSLAWGGAAVITPNEESVKEVTVQSSPYSAENGRNSGAEVLLVSKNGTNSFHGSALFRATRPGLNAYQRWNGPNNAPVQRDTDRFNQWAGSIGGPILKNHLFFFFSYETLRNSTSTLAQGWYETPQFLSSVTNPNSIAAKVAGYPGEGPSFNAIVPKSCADIGLTSPGQCQAIFSGGQYQGLDVGSPLKTPLGTPDPTYGGSSGTPGVGSGLDGIPDIFFVQSVNPTTTAPQQYNGRLDYQATSKDLITFSEYWVPNDSTFYNGPVRAANFWHSDRLNYAATLVWDHTISAKWLNEARGGVTRWYFNEISSNPQEPWGLPQENIDNLGTANPQFLGAPGPGVFYQTTYNFRDTASAALGKHSLKLGFDLYKEQDNDNEVGAGRPQYSFRNLWDFANDAPYTESGNFNPSTGMPTSATKYIRSNIYAFFVQDDYKVKPNLTLSLGLRWEYFSPVREKYGNISNVILG
ncbi:MAG: TonB-dependent receptor, partial [Acidobacteriaceae bacterium]|nr:TonB-dependent receptor [Acidobacteriaceae bacterium]